MCALGTSLVSGDIDWRTRMSRTYNLLSGTVSTNQSCPLMTDKAKNPILLM